MEERQQKIIDQKNLNHQKRIRMQEKLIIEKELRNKINLKSQIRQEKYMNTAYAMKLELEDKIRKRSQSQSILFAENQERAVRRLLPRYLLDHKRGYDRIFKGEHILYIKGITQ